MDEHEKDLAVDPASRKSCRLEDGDNPRFLFRGEGCFGRYSERLVTTYKHPGNDPDSYLGGADSAPFYYENEAV